MGLGLLATGGGHSSPTAQVRSRRFFFKSTAIIVFFSFASIASFLSGHLQASDDVRRDEIASPFRWKEHWNSLELRSLLHSDDEATDERASSPKEAPCKDCEDAENNNQCSLIFTVPKAERCEHAQRFCKDAAKSLINYTELHFCELRSQSWLSVPILVLGVIAAFYLLAETAEDYFCPVVGRISNILNLGPSTAGVTFLAFGNGAPDVFSSLAAFVGGNPKIGFGAIVSAGAFVTAFVVGCVAIAAAPFAVKARAFTRDILFYAIGASGVFAVYFTGQVYLWQAVSFVLFYIVFVSVVVLTDRLKLGLVHRDQSIVEFMHKDSRHQAEERALSPTSLCGERRVALQRAAVGASSVKYRSQENGDGVPVDSESDGSEEVAPKVVGSPDWRRARQSTTVWGPIGTWVDKFQKLSWFEKVCHIIHKPFDVARKATIPAVDDTSWNHTYATSNVILCPIIFLYICSPFLPFETNISFFAPTVALPMWALVLIQSSVLGLAFFIANPYTKPPETGRKAIVFVAFAMSIFWISMLASELLGLLVALGTIIGLSPAILGLTVLAWGNSIGDLVADVTVARAGQPTMAVAGCFAGPMFNMLVGLGLPLTIRTASSYPDAYPLHFHPNIPIAFCFLFASLLGSLFVVSCSGFQVRRTWGVCLISLYVGFTVISLVVESGLVMKVPNR